jgi:hypothetical protein
MEEAVGADEGVLGDVVRHGGIPEEMDAQPPYVALIGAHQRLERDRIPAPGFCNDLWVGLVHAVPPHRLSRILMFAPHALSTP